MADHQRGARRPGSQRPDRAQKPDRAQRPDRSERGGRGRGPRPEPVERRSTRSDEPELPEDVTGAELDRHVRRDLATLSKDNASAVARHLVMAGRLVDVDAAAALRHALAAQRRAGRVAVVRETAGLVAYHAGDYELALRELRTARRMSGSSEHLPVMADCERGLGRPERALTLAAGPEAARLDRAGQIELTIVVAGARIDLGQPEAAVVLLQLPELERPPTPETAGRTARLMSAYSDALGAAGRTDEARRWLERAAATDPDSSTGAAERLGEGIEVLIDLEDEPDHE
ncbi:MAG TPA: hypothetical protein VFD41_08290 [Actinomycetales bacterium]|nr:hypothetical protein [Actinomycetales bacterium]